MALEAVVFPQHPFAYGGSNSSSSKDLYNLQVDSSAGGSSWSYELANENDYFLGNQTENSPDYYYVYGDDYWNPSMDQSFNDLQLPRDPSPEGAGGSKDETAVVQLDAEITAMQGGSGSSRPARRRRSKTQKNKEEIENQRMTHITVERNRRKQMNEYLSVLRSLMPDSYVQRGDQASIIGGAINFVKELEQQVHSLSAQTDVKALPNGGPKSVPFSHFFTFPQYSTSSSSSSSSSSSPSSPSLSLSPDLGCDSRSFSAMAANDHHHHPPSTASSTNQMQSSVADIEVSMADSHANLKIRCKKLPKQLLKIVSGLHRLRLTVLHLNVSTVHQIVLYSFSVKVEEDCRLSSVDEIARATYQLLCRIQEEAFSI